jgi:hypothetical protein
MSVRKGRDHDQWTSRDAHMSWSMLFFWSVFAEEDHLIAETNIFDRRKDHWSEYHRNRHHQYKYPNF